MVERPSGIGPAPDARVFTEAITVPGLPVVLDAGFGDGRLRPQLVPGCRWIGVEIDAARVRAGAARGWCVARADITAALPLASASVHGVVLSCVLNTVAPRELRGVAVREVGRVLRPGGVVWVRDFVRLSEPDSRIGTVVSAAHWAAMRRRYALGTELAAWVCGRPPGEFSPGTFPAFDLGPGADAGLFRTHRYTADGFRDSVRSGRIQVPFLACHLTHDELCAEWRELGDLVAVRCGFARTRGGDVLPADDIVVRKRGC
jgi:SAM-dependent methyltransferase